MTGIKFCGLKREEDILFANVIKPEFVGFVFAQRSKRYVSPEKAARLKELLSPDIASVGVFVNEREENVAALLLSGVADIAQLHGDEDDGYIKRLRRLTDRPVIKAFCVRSASDIHSAQRSEADFVLLDAPVAGSGTQFDSSLLKYIHRDFFLAGGLDANNVKELIREFSPYAVDVSSGIETNGTKDMKKMRAFAKAARERT